MMQHSLNWKRQRSDVRAVDLELHALLVPVRKSGVPKRLALDAIVQAQQLSVVNRQVDQC